MGSCCGKHHTRPAPPAPGANGRRTVVENVAFHRGRAEGAPPRLRAATATPRCGRCKAKIQFCTCDVRRDTMPSRKLQVVPRSASSAIGNRNSAQHPRRVMLTGSGPAKQPHHPPSQRQQQPPRKKGGGNKGKPKRNSSSTPPPRQQQPSSGGSSRRSAQQQQRNPAKQPHHSPSQGQQTQPPRKKGGGKGERK